MHIVVHFSPFRHQGIKTSPSFLYHNIRNKTLDFSNEIIPFSPIEILEYFIALSLRGIPPAEYIGINNGIAISTPGISVGWIPDIPT